jgi:hypothetical protein
MSLETTALTKISTADERQSLINSMGPKTKAIHDRIEQLMVSEGSLLIKNRWKVGKLAIELVALANIDGELDSLSKVASSLGLGTELYHFKKVAEAYPTESDIDEVCNMRDALGRPLSYSKLILVCASNIAPKERNKLVDVCLTECLTVKDLKARLVELLNTPGRKSLLDPSKDYVASSGGRRAKAGAVMSPRSLSAAGRKISTMASKVLEARAGIEEAYDKFFEDPEAVSTSTRHEEIFQQTSEVITELQEALDIIRSKNDAVLVEIQKAKEEEASEDRTLEVPAKMGKLKRQKLDPSEAIANAKSKAEIV